MMTAQNPEPGRKSSKVRRERKKSKTPVAGEERSPKESRAEKSAAGSGNVIERIRKFLAAVASEFRRVSWPSRPELVAGTVVVMFTLFMFASYLGFLDFALGNIFRAVGH